MGSTDEDYDAFFRAEFAGLVGFVMTVGFDRDAARDAAAEAMTRAYPRWAEIDQPRAWVRMVAAREARGAAKRRADGLNRAGAHGWLAEPVTDPATPVLQEEQGLVVELLWQLPARRRMVMALHIDGFSASEIAEHLGITPETTRSHLRHAREQMRQQLSARGIGPFMQEGDCDD